LQGNIDYLAIGNFLVRHPALDISRYNAREYENVTA
jgi:hypothetical protein